MASWLIGFGSPAATLRRAVRLSEEGKAVEAFPLLARAAKAGNAEAEYRVARCYLEGSGMPASRTEGTRWLERGAGHGHVEAQTLLAAICVNGLADLRTIAGDGQADRLFVTEEQAGPDYDSALKWSRQAAEAGSAQGQAMLAYVLTNGPEAMRDLEAAHRWYERSAAAGCPEGCLGYALSLAPRTHDAPGRRQVADYLGRAAQAMLPTAIYLLGVMAEQGVGLARDPAAAMELYRNAAELGVRSAQTRWGLALIEGQFVKQDLLNGETWLRRAALAGDAEAAVLVADLNISNRELPPNYTQAASWYRRAAEAGHKAAAHALGSLYLTGEGVAPDPEEAARWLRVSALAGDERSQVDLANLVLQGAGNPEDPASVARWFEQAAASWDLVASFNLGIALAKGVGMEADDEQAAKWLRQAAEGLPQAQYIYGRMLADGRGVAADLTAARDWFARAADSGLGDAQVALAEMMVNGRGGPADIPAALQLFEKAAAEGHVGAMFALGALHGGGHQIPTDRKIAQRWLTSAAEEGHGYAQLMLGRYLAAGVNGEPQPEEARDWFARALAQGIIEAEEDLAALPPGGDSDD
ncbi:MAG TPA: tetratricopeptide repeat protein, partial [Dongiaceae bacterium]